MSQNVRFEEKSRTRLTASVATAAVLLVASIQLQAQLGGGNSAPKQATGVSTVQAAQQTLSTVNGASGSTTPSGGANSDFRGSVISGTSTGSLLDLSLDDAVARGLRANLGLILQTSTQQNAGGQRLQALQALLPTITGNVSYQVQQVNLAASGINFPGLNPIIGPFQVFDFRASLTQSLVNVSSIQKFIASKHNFQGAKLTAADARDMVVLTVGNAYLLCIADAARIESVRADLANAKVSLDQATAAHDAGTSPKLDVLRAQVDYQNEQQQLISTTNQLAKDKLALARAIGMPLDQEFRLTDSAPYKALDHVDPLAAFDQAVKSRKDLAAAAETVKGDQAQKTAAWAQQLPEAHVSGDFGDIGNTVGHSHGTYSAKGEITAPILQIAKTRGDIQVADAALQQSKARLSDQLQQVNADVRDSILDIEAAARLVDATTSNVALANEALSEAQQRFSAGVADNLAVSDAQAQAEQAHDQYISALYQHNVAKLSLARALGIAETNYKTYLGRN